jgi:hypothetical protein
MSRVIITFVVKYHMWVVGSHTILRGMNKDVYLLVAKSQPLPFHIQNNYINKIIITRMYYVSDVWQHTIRTKS